MSQKSRCPGREPTAPNHVHPGRYLDHCSVCHHYENLREMWDDPAVAVIASVPTQPEPTSPAFVHGKYAGSCPVCPQEAASAPPVAAKANPQPQPTPGPEIDAAGFGPWPSEERMREHEARGGWWLARQGGEMMPGQLRGLVLGRFSTDSKRICWWVNGRSFQRESLKPWSFCPIDDSGDKLDAAPVLRGEDARRLVESLGEVAPPEEIARRRVEARERLAKGTPERKDLLSMAKDFAAKLGEATDLQYEVPERSDLCLSEEDAKRLTEQAKDVLNLHPLTKADRCPQCDEYLMSCPKCRPVAVTMFDEVSKVPERGEYDRCPLCGHVRLLHGATGCRHIKLTDGQQCDCWLMHRRETEPVGPAGFKDEHIRLALGRETTQRILSTLPARSPDRRALVVLRGLPGSGKSTAAQAIADSDPARWARVSKDDIRQMMVGPNGDLFRFVEDRAREVVVSKAAEETAISALRLGLDVVVDATNLTERALGSWRMAAMVANRDGHGPILVCERAVDTPLEECVARDKLRGKRSVGEAVIQRLAATIDLPLADREWEAGS